MLASNANHATIHRHYPRASSQREIHAAIARSIRRSHLEATSTNCLFDDLPGHVGRHVHGLWQHQWRFFLDGRNLMLDHSGSNWDASGLSHSAVSEVLVGQNMVCSKCQMDLPFARKPSIERCCKNDIPPFSSIMHGRPRCAEHLSHIESLSKLCLGLTWYW